MKAPNGRPTKLSERRWAQVRTPLFKERFGDWEALEELRIGTEVVTKTQVEDYLKSIIGVDIVNLETNIKARIGSSQSGKLVSNAATQRTVENGFTVDQHNKAVAKLEKLWKHATLIEERADKKNDVNIKSIKRFVAPLDFDGEIGFANMLIKESVEHGHRIYTVELQEINKLQSILSELDTEHTPIRSIEIRINQLRNKVNPSEVSAARDAETGEPLVVYTEAGTGLDSFVENMNPRRKAKVVAAFLDMKNPLMINDPDLDPDKYVPPEEAAKRGHDGVVFDDGFMRMWEPVNRESVIDAGPYTAGGSPRFQLIGEQGAAALDEAEETNTRLNNLGVARQMEAAGKDAKTVRLATGWERGADGKWRYEIPDIVLKNPLENGAYEKLPDIIDNKELFKAYPELETITVEVNDIFSGSGMIGRYNGKESVITLDPGWTRGRHESALAHEIQHAIQSIEGFAAGGSPDTFSSIPDEKAIREAEATFHSILAGGRRENHFFQVRDIRKRVQERRETVDRINGEIDKLDLDDETTANSADTEGLFKSAAEAEELLRNAAESLEYYDNALRQELGDEAYRKVWKAYSDWAVYPPKISPLEQYQRLGGEVEARNVEARMGFTAQQRLETLLAETEDVSREDQLFLTEGARVMAAMPDGENADNEGRTQIKHMGEYVLNSSGNKDFGVIPEIKGGEKIYKSAPIRLRIGEHDNQTDKGYGEKHIERTERLAQLKKNGYNNVRDLVEDIANNYSAVYEAKRDALFLIKKTSDNHRLAVIKLEDKGDRFYDVKTAYIVRPDFMKNKKLLWEKSQGRDGRSPSGNMPPSAVSGNPVPSLSPDSGDKSSGNFDNSPALLFQLTEEEGMNEARAAAEGGESREAFINRNAEEGADAPGDADGEADYREWLGELYDRAKGKGGRRYTTTEADEMLVERLRGDKEGFTEFLRKAGALLDSDPETLQAADKALRAELKAVARPGRRSRGYTLFENAAKAAFRGSEVKDSTKASLITYMAHYMSGDAEYPGFRDIYTRLTGDEKFVKLAETEIYEDYVSGVKDRGRMTPYETGRAVERIKSRELRKKIRTEAVTEGDYKKALAEADREINELEAEYKKALAEAAADYKKAVESGDRAVNELAGEYQEALDDAEQIRDELETELEAEKAYALDKAEKSKLAALKKLKAKIKARQAERAAAARLLADMRRIYDRAGTQPSNNMDAKTAAEIKALQAGFAEAYKKGKTPDYVYCFR